MKQGLTHILDQSVCLTRRQLRDYLAGAMLPVEAHAVEVHLASCPLCSMAMEGFEEHSEEALQAIASLNSGFLKEHFDNIAPQIHLNSMAPAAAAPAAHRNRRSIALPAWRLTGIAAAVALAVGIFWFIDHRGTPAGFSESQNIAMADEQRRAPAVATTLPPQSDAAPSASRQAATAAPAGETARATVSKDILPKPAARPEVSADKTSPAEDRTVAASAAAEAPVRRDAAPGRAAAADDQPSAKAKKLSGDLSLASSRSVAATNYIAEPAPPSAMPAPATATARAKSLAAQKPARTGEAAASGAGKASEPEQAAAPEISPMLLGNEAYSQGKYTTALKHYQQQMTIGDAGDRQRAAIMAAQCYTALGNRTKAEQLLQSIADNGNGPERRAARRALRKLQ